MGERIDRREFLNRILKLGLVAGGAGLLIPVAGCSSGSEATQQPAQATPPGAPSAGAETTVAPTQAAAMSPVPSASVAPGLTAAPSTPIASPSPIAVASPTATVQVSDVSDLAVVKGGDVQAIVRAAVDAVGGMQKFVPRGSKVLLKANVGFNRAPEYAATTNPAVVAAVIALCKEAGAAQITSFDNAVDGPNIGYELSGIRAAVQQAGGTMERISSMKWKQVQLPKGRELHSVYIYQTLLDADVIIDVPIAKHHNLAGLTMGMKNMMGTVRDRAPFHNNIGQRVADLCTFARPALTVIDATHILLRNGPSGGNLADVKQLDTIIASADIVAADSYGATLFGIKGLDLDTARVGEQMGLGTTDISKLKIATLSL